MSTYDPKSVQVIVGALRISGFADGTFVNVTRTSDSFTMTTGADGKTSRAKSNDFSGTVTLTLLQTSESNQALSILQQTDEQTGTGVVPILITDSIGTTNLASGKGWIRKPADVEYGKEITGREWTIDCADLVMNIGGNPDF